MKPAPHCAEKPLAAKCYACRRVEELNLIFRDRQRRKYPRGGRWAAAQLSTSTPSPAANP
jgi:hypothetical protein